MAISLKFSDTKDCYRLVVPNSGGFMVVDTRDILYVESDINYSRIYFSNGNKTLMTSKTLKEFSDLLEPIGFFRIHQSYLINPDFIQEYRRTDNELQLQNGKVLPIARQRKLKFRDFFG